MTEVPSGVPLLETLGRTYQSLGEYERSDQLLQRSVEMNRSRSPALHAQGLFYLGETQILNGEYEHAKASLEQGLAIAETTLGENSELSLKIQGKLGRLYERMADIDQANRLLSDTLERVRQHHPENFALLASALNDMAAVALIQGNYAEVEPLLREAIVLHKALDQRAAQNQALPLSSPMTATLVNNLGLVIYFQGRLDEAEILYRESLQIRRQILDAEHPDLAQSLTNLGLLLNETGRLKESGLLLQEALEIKQRSLPDGHIQIMSGMSNLAMVKQAAHEYEQAEQLYTDALDGAINAFGDKHPVVATTESNLASVLFDLKN